MTRTQRIGFLSLAAAIAVAAVIVLGGGDESGPRSAATPTPAAATPTPDGAAAETPTPTPTPPPRPPLLSPGRERVVEVRQDDIVRFEVRSPEADHVHVHGYDVMRELPARRTVTVRFKADIPGIFEIELEDAGVPLGRLRVEP